MFWRVELDKEGSIKSCDLCEDKAKTSGGLVIYIEAEGKAQACDKAKVWWADKYKHRTIERNLGMAELRRQRNACDVCGGAPWRDGTTRCKDHRLMSIGGKLRTPEPKPPETAEKKQDRERKDLMRHMSARIYGELLRKLDELGHDRFRSWLALKANVREDKAAAE